MISYSEPLPPQRLRTRSAGSLHQRFIAIAFVIGVHALMGLALLTQKTAVEPESPPLIVRLLEAQAISEQSPPPAVPHFEPSQLPVVIMPEAITVEETTPAAMTAAAIEAPAEATQTVSARESVVEARFDADYLNNPQPAYPSISRRMREEGRVVLKVKVRADGTVDAVLVQQRSGSLRLDEAALAAVKHWRFIPAKRGDQSIESWVFVPIEFGLKA